MLGIIHIYPQNPLLHNRTAHILMGNLVSLMHLYTLSLQKDYGGSHLLESALKAVTNILNSIK